MKYQRKPEEVQVYRVGDVEPAWLLEAILVGKIFKTGLGDYIVPMGDDRVTARRPRPARSDDPEVLGDFIIRSKKGTISLCHPDAFEENYELIREPAAGPSAVERLAHLRNEAAASQAGEVRGEASVEAGTERQSQG